MTSNQRCLMILRRLQDRRRRGCTVRELAELTGRDLKTVRRDLDAIRGAGFRLLANIEPHARKRYRVQS